jgi:hypothetical protein
MLAPLISELLIVSLLFLLVGWASDALRASMHDSQGYLDSEGTTASKRMSRPRQLRPHDDHVATWTSRPVGRHQHPGQLPSYRLAIGRLLPHGPEPRRCHDSVS